MNQQGRFAQSHRLLGTLLWLALTPVEILVQVEAQLLSEAPQADVLLLRREAERWSAAQRARLPDGVRDSPASHVLIEFKYTESTNERVLTQATSYDHFYRQGQRLSEAEVLTVLLSAKTPQRKRLSEWGYTATQKGVYRSELPLLRRVLLLVLNELPAAPHNAFAKSFASRGAERASGLEALQEATANSSTELRAYVMGLLETLQVRGGIEMTDVITPEMVMERGKQWVRAALEAASPEERLAGLEPEELLSAMSEVERQKLLRLLLSETDSR